MADIATSDDSDARARVDGGLRDHGHQRVEGFRHHLEHGAGVFAGPRDHAGPDDLQRRLYGRYPLGSGERSRRDPVPLGRPCHAVESQEDQGVDAMSQVPSLRENRVVTLMKRFRLSKAVVNVILGLVAIFWLVPTISLLVISLRPESLFGTSGWWTVITAPSQLTWGNYTTIFSQGFAAGGVLDSLLTSLE